MWDGSIPHFEALGGTLYAVAKAPIERVAAFADEHGCRNIRPLSAARSNQPTCSNFDSKQPGCPGLCCANFF
jgi:predicted dithiol-disulfide oxidoreductase (DUF899 family)